MAAARMLGIAGGRLRSASAVIGAPRLPPFAPHAGRRCPLAAPAPLLGPAAAGPADGLLARLAALLRRRAPETDARPLNLPPFSTGGGARSGGGANGVPGKRDEGAGVDCKHKAEEERGGGGKGLDAGGSRTKEVGGGAAKTADGKDGVDAGGGRTKDVGAGSQAKDADAVGNIAKGSNGGEEQLDPAVSKNLIFSFAKVVETVLKKSLKAEWKIVDEDLHDHSRRIVYLVLAGVLLEMVIVVAVAMVAGAWLGIVKAKQLIKYLTTSQESMEMYHKAADAALSILYNALAGKGRKMIHSVFGTFVATEEGKAEEEDKAGEEDKTAEQGRPAGEDGVSAGGEGGRTGDRALLFLMMFAIFLF